MKTLFSNIIGSSGVDLLILHGFLGMGDNWRMSAKSLVKIGNRVHHLDQRNHGRRFLDDAIKYSERSSFPELSEITEEVYG